MSDVDFRDVGTLTLNGYCTCGGSCKVTSNPPAHARGIAAAFRDAHQGEGHSPCDQKTAAAARRKANRESSPA